MANVIDIVIKATDQTGGTMNKVNAAFKQLTGFSLSAAGGVAAAGFAFQKLVQFVRQSVDETEKYVTSITDMSRVLGLNTEETSRLVQASDDLFISQDRLNTALLAASRKGIDVSIEGLKKLSTQYLALNSGVQRSQFLMQNFGRSGADMGKMMEIGADGIDSAMQAVQKSLIVTQESANNILNYKRSVDNLTDSWQGFKYTVGNQVIPQLDLLMRQLTSGVDPVEQTELAVNGLNAQIQNLEKYGGMAGLSQEEIARQVAAARAEIEKLTTSTNNQVSAQKFLEASTISATTYFKELTKEMLFNLAAEGLDSDQALILAESMGLIDSAARAQIDAIQLLRAEYADTGDLDAYVGKLGSLAKMLEYINIMSNVNINWGGSGYGGYGTSDVNYQNQGGGNVKYSPTVTEAPVVINKQSNGGMSQSDMTQFATILSTAVASAVSKTRD